MGDPTRGISPHDGSVSPTRAGGLFRSAGRRFTRCECVARRPAPGQQAAYKHPRVQRWRASVSASSAANGRRGRQQRESWRLSSSGIFGRTICLKSGFNSSNVRDVTQQNLLNANVTNLFFIGNFEPLRTSNPPLYNEMARKSFFTSPTIPRNRLLRPFPHMSSGDGLEFRDPGGRREQGALELRATSPGGSPMALPPASSTQGHACGKIGRSRI